MSLRAMRGITLIELACCLAILAVLSMVALSGYRESIHRARRSDARHALLQLQVLQERHYFSTGRYAATLAELSTPPPPATSPEGWYRLGLRAAADGEDYLAWAEPAEGPQQRDGLCRRFTLDAAGARSAQGGAGAAERCWR
jgi:type IV pilus assembly protein PilE